MKILTSQTAKQMIAMHILPIMSSSKGNQVVEFGQLIDYNKRYIFLKSYTKCDGEASPRPFYKKARSSVSLDQQSETL